MSLKTEINQVWLEQLGGTAAFGETVKPRGLTTSEFLNDRIQINMKSPVITVEERRLNYKFMAAEAFWILTGNDKVDGIAPFNRHISDFSDDGKVFFGAYGPKITDQMQYVVETLHEDNFSRRACLTIWRENPPPTKDYPCTVAMVFSIRNGKLHNHVFMRSSDLWLGVPYDLFNFSMVAYMVCAKLRKIGTIVEPGLLMLTAVSSHLYEKNQEEALDLVGLYGYLLLKNPKKIPVSPQAPKTLWESEVALLALLNELRFTQPGSPLRWWEYGHD
jgi:thymidylate synthase